MYVDVDFNVDLTRPIPIPILNPRLKKEALKAGFVLVDGL